MCHLLEFLVSQAFEGFSHASEFPNLRIPRCEVVIAESLCPPPVPQIRRSYNQIQRFNGLNLEPLFPPGSWCVVAV